MVIDDTRLEQLGTYFQYHNLREEGYTFERFLQHVLNGNWNKYNKGSV